MPQIDPQTLLTLLDAARDVLVEIDDDGRATIVRADGEHERHPLAGLVHPGDVAEVERALGARPPAGTHFELTVHTRVPADNGYRMLVWTCHRRDGGWLCLWRDAEHVARLQEAQETALIGHWEYIPETGVLYPSELLRRRIGLEGERPEMPLDNYFAFVPEDDRDRARAVWDDAVAEGRSFHGEWRLDLPDSASWYDVRGRPVHDGDGKLVAYRGTALNITERKRSEGRVAEAEGFLAAVTDHMAEGLYTVDRKGRLTHINPAAEHMLGWRGEDLMGRRMHDVIHHTRANGDPHPREECPMTKVLRDGVTVRVEDDVFVRRNGSKLPVSYSSAPLLTDGRTIGSVVVFSDISERKAEQLRLLREIDELAWVSRIQDTLRDGRFVLYAQPIVHLGTRKVVQHELLLRMRQGDDLIAPGEFLPTAEKYGLIQNIDRWVVWEAARLAADGVPVELNISAETCGSPDLLDTFEAALDASGAAPEDLVVEITETALMKGDAVDDLVAGLTAMGIRLALDDFGTGYGGFTYLKRLPVHFLKIDREFVRDLGGDRASRHVVDAVVTLARGFGQKTIAEGVEDAETLAILGELGVDYAQGFHLGRPAPVERVLAGWQA
jgi:PAS domain S-box-containing protein